EQLAAKRIDLFKVLREPPIAGIRTEPLQVVVEMREITECQRRIASPHHMERCSGNPSTRFDVGSRSPELEQRKWTELRIELVVKVGRIGVMIRYLAAVGRIDRAWRRAPVDRRMHI